MTERDIRKIATFFYYALPHELLALEATDKAIAKIKKRQSKELDKFTDVVMVSECNSVASLYLDKYRKKREKLTDHRFNETYEKIKDPFELGASLNFGPWRQFVREQNSDDLLNLIWIHVLETKLEFVALASQITAGTMTHRMSKLMGTLGNTLVPGTNKPEQGV